MANRYSLSNKAVEDLSSIWEYTFENWSEAQADKYYFMLLDSCQGIADEKLRAKRYPEVHPEILGCKVAQRIIFFRRLKNNKIEIVRILHSQMDLKNRMKE